MFVLLFKDSLQVSTGQRIVLGFLSPGSLFAWIAQVRTCGRRLMTVAPCTQELAGRKGGRVGGEAQASSRLVLTQGFTHPNHPPTPPLPWRGLRLHSYALGNPIPPFWCKPNPDSKLCLWLPINPSRCCHRKKFLTGLTYAGLGQLPLGRCQQGGSWKVCDRLTWLV